jgi:hypothetical protein
MDEATYEAERSRLRELYGETSKEANAKREQALATLFFRSGWTQEQLAAKEGKSQQWVVTRLRFGRFLNFTTTVVNSETIPNNLTEGRFRSFWERTEGDERQRFREVINLMRAEVSLRRNNRPSIGKALVKRYGDGKWHSVPVMARALDTDEDHVAATLDTMKALRGTYGARSEKKTVGTELQYRLFKMNKTISSSELTEKLAPIVKDLEEQGRKNQVTMSVTQVAVLANRLRKLLDEWAG